MGARAGYTPGTFSWTDLTTTDQEAAKAFYGGLFGWVAEDLPVGDDAYYSMQRKDGRDVAAISPQPEPQRDAGVPPAWNSYVTVENADAIVDRALELGATVPVPPFDVMEAGRMAAIQDPQGAYLLIWQPNQHLGAQLVNEPGALSWNELASPDLDASSVFYAALFDWTFEPFESSPEPYLTIKNGDIVNGGVRTLNSPGPPPHWLVYFAVDDLDASLAKVSELGGTTHAGPIDIGIARIAVVADPQGAMFALYDGRLDP
jgi:predicted enzyme related to lactoylglutathione lyase